MRLAGLLFSRNFMRRFLDGLYRVSGVLAASFLVAICTIVLAQVGSNVIDKFAGWLFGEVIGLLVPSYREFAGFFLASATFLALTHTLRVGGHIRVSLLIQHLPRRRRRWIELWCLALATLLVGYFSFFTVNMVVEAVHFGDLSYGILPIKLWIPQSAMALGLIVFTVALADEFVSVLRGREASYQASEDETAAGASLHGPASGE